MAERPATEAIGRVRTAVTRRWQAIDPFLPEPSEPAEACGADLTVTSADGHIAAAGFCRHLHLRRGSLELAWGAARQFGLTAWVAGRDIGMGLGQLLERWRGHLAQLADTAEDDSSAIVRWPSRDIEGIRALLEHGLRPLTVIAARPAGRAIDGNTAGACPVGLRIRPAGRGDVHVLERLAMELTRYDSHFGAVEVRSDTADGLRQWAAQVLAAARPWTWIAERDGEAVGMVHAEPPESATWAAPLVRAQSVAYLAEMSVLPGSRGAGVGTALVEYLHRDLDVAGATVTLLHHAQLNPLSAPFWSRMGYRPLWTSWEVRPASRLSSSWQHQPG
jgi:GNAT superfamily N-acetyltransferase